MTEPLFQNDGSSECLITQAIHKTNQKGKVNIMAKKNIYGELIKNANGADFLSVQNISGTVAIIHKHWVYQTTEGIYREYIASNLKGFPVLKDGESLGRITKKQTVEWREPYKVQNLLDRLGDMQTATISGFECNGISLVKCGEHIIGINGAYLGMGVDIFGDSVIDGVNEVSPIRFSNSSEMLLILPININGIKDKLRELLNETATAESEPKTEVAEPVAEAKAEEPVKEEKPVKAKKAKAEKKPTTKKAETKKAEKKQSKKAEPKKAEPTNEEVAKAYWRKNEEHKGIEVVFPSSPKAEIRTALKSNGFRWHNTKKMWFAKETKDRLALVKSLVG